jgi:hypothetical protein
VTWAPRSARSWSGTSPPATCEQTLAELRRVAMRAGSLVDRAPERDLWPDIARRIGVAVDRPAPAVRASRHRAFTFTLSQLAAAAGVLLAVGAGAMWVGAGMGKPVSGPAGRPGPVSVAPSVGATPAAATDVAGSVAYANAVADLERALAANRARLDTATVRVIEESLQTIDRAIARARAALAADPSDMYLNAHLAETMRRKLELMRRAVALATRAS